MTYGKGGSATTIAGAALLPNTGNDQVLFSIAVGFIVLGISILALSLLLAHKNRQVSSK